MTWRLVKLFVVTLGVSIVGCSDKQATYPVKGKVEYKDGSPVPGGTVEFKTEVDDKTINARGIIGPDGSFELKTFKEGDGAVAGEHKAILVPPAVRDETVRASEVFPRRYLDYKTSGLRFTVKPKPNEIVIKVEKPK